MTPEPETPAPQPIPFKKSTLLALDALIQSHRRALGDLFTETMKEDGINPAMYSPNMTPGVMAYTPIDARGS